MKVKINFSTYIPNGDKYEIDDYITYNVSEKTFKQLQQIVKYNIDDLSDWENDNFLFWFLSEKLTDESKEILNEINNIVKYTSFSIDKVEIIKENK